jgi:hypothetical protein
MQHSLLEYGLEAHTTKAVPFNEYGEYKCTNPDYVTDDGFFFKLKCLSNGQFQRRFWFTCRPRQTCTKTPPRPLVETGLANNYSREVLEFDFATYKCIDDQQVLNFNKKENLNLSLHLIEFQVVPGTVDGLFRVICKKKGIYPQASGKYGVDWPVCGDKPTDICEPIIDTPTGYVDDFTRTLYVQSGTEISFKCAEEGYLAGDTEKLYYKWVFFTLH